MKCAHHMIGLITSSTTNPRSWLGTGTKM